ncbi:O-antigen ligase family protein [Anaerosporobacter sp.]
MSNVSHSKKHNKINSLLIPLAIIIIIVPLIVYEYNFTPSIANEAWFPDANTASDFFLFYKSIIVIGIGFLLMAILLYKQFASKQKPFTNFQLWQIPLAVYAIFVLVSSFTSSYSDVAWNGTYEQFETALVLIAYCILLFYSYYIVKKEDDIQAILRFLLIGIALITFIGLLQVLGLDPIATTVGKYLISANKSKEAIDAMQFTFEKNRVYMTLLNPNYVGVYASMLFPITMGLVILSKDNRKRIFSGILTILLAVAVFGSQSKTGLITLAGTSVLVIISLRKKIFTNKKIAIVIAGAFVVLIAGFFTINAMQNNAYLNSIKNALSVKNQTHTLESIQTKHDYVEIKYNGKTVLLRCELDEEGKIDFSVTDEEGNNIKANYDQTTMTFTLEDESFNSLSVKPVYLSEDGIFGCEVIIDNNTWYFKSKTETEGYSYMNKYGRFDQIKDQDSSLLTNYGQLFTGRGYLWSRTIPLLKDYILVGEGPSTFVYVFPQNDYVGKYNNGFDSQIVTKPHNLYLQMAVETGVISSIAFIVLCLMFIIQSIMTYRKSALDNLIEQTGVLICVAVIGYMVSGLINDSNVGVAPIFWILLGVGFACNRIIKETRERKKKLESL